MSTVSGHRYWISPPTNMGLGVYSLGVYKFGSHQLLWEWESTDSGHRLWIRNCALIGWGSGSLHSASLQSQATDVGSGNHFTCRSPHCRSLQSRATGFGLVNAHSLGWESIPWSLLSRCLQHRATDIGSRNALTCGSLHSRSLHPGSLQSRATDLRSGNTHSLDWESTL